MVLRASSVAVAAAWGVAMTGLALAQTSGDPASTGSDGPDIPVRAARFVPATAIHLPTQAEMDSYFPDAARQQGVGGRAHLLCRIQADLQRLRDCRVQSEIPSGYGFGAAAIKIAKFYRIRPPTLGGKPVADAPLRLTIGFRMAPAAALTAQPSALPAPPSPSALRPPPTPQRPLGRSPDALWMPVSFLLVVLGAIPAVLFWPKPKTRALKKAGQYA